MLKIVTLKFNREQLNIRDYWKEMKGWWEMFWKKCPVLEKICSSIILLSGECMK